MRGSRKSVILSVLLISSQIMTEGVMASELSYSGTTQIATVDYALEINTFSTQLEVEEVYVSAGDVIAEGDAVLKFTDESYQSAVSYYEAALLKANNALTDMQREYDNGVLEVQSTYDIAQAEADNAEFIREYQSNEVASALEEHDEMLEKIDERIEELQSGIDDGSYETTTSGGSGTGGGNSGTNSSPDTDTESEAEKPEEPEEDGETEKPEDPEESGETEKTGDPEEDTESEPETDPTESPVQDQENEEENNDSEMTELLDEIEEKEAELEENQLTLAEELGDALDGVISDQSDISEDYSTYSQQLTNMIEQLKTNIDYQNTAKSEEQTTDAQNTAIENSIKGDEAVLASLEEIQGKIETYSVLINVIINIFPTDELTQKAVLSTDTLDNINDYMDQTAEVVALYQKLLLMYDEKVSTLEEELKTDGEAPTGEDNEATETPAPTETPASTETAVPTGTPESIGTTDQKQTDPVNMSSGGTDFSGSSSTSSGMGGDSGVYSATSEGSIGMENNIAAMDGSDISLLGNTYDLTSTESLIEKEPTDNDAAEDLITELEEAKEKVQLQYEELQRKERSYELQIQYNYDTAVLTGKLSEITYQEDRKSWEEKLKSSQQAVTDLEEEQSILLACEDGILRAAQSGTLAAVNYEAEDTINPMTSILSYYQMDVVSIALQVPQEEIHALAVGDTVEVILGGRSTYEGTVSEKSIEPDSGTARGDVEYTVMVSLDNQEGRISSGTAATIVIKDETGEENDEQ